MTNAAVAAQLRQLIAGGDLARDAVAQTIGAIIDGALVPTQSAAWLAALAAKGETTEEIIGAAQAMRSRALRVEHACARLLDVCGTGGDGHDTINISTAVAFIAASCGIAVAKHGNRSSSSRCGSADVLEALGVEIDRSPAAAQAALDAGQVAFLFAQRYHPAMKAVAQLRRELGVRTIFNLLGPLTNPARATHQLIGVSDARKLDRVAYAAQALGTVACGVVHAANGLDEIAGDAVTTMLHVTATGVHVRHIDPAQYGVQATLADIRGGDVRENAQALLAILSGERSPRADLVALNAAVALYIAEVAETIEAGLIQAREALSSGAALHALTQLQAEPHISYGSEFLAPDVLDESTQ